jgi:hypothetical protein
MKFVRLWLMAVVLVFVVLFLALFVGYLSTWGEY